MLLNIIETLDTDGNIVEAIVLNSRWLKPIDELKTTFTDNIFDPNTGIINALWRRNELLDGDVVGTFDSFSKLDSFNYERLIEFLDKYQ